MSISLTPLRYSAAIVLSPTIEMHVSQEKIAWNFLSRFAGLSRGVSNRLSVSELIAPPSFRGGPGRLRSPDEAQHVFDHCPYGLVRDVPSQNLPGEQIGRGSSFPLSRPFWEGTHTPKFPSLPHKRDRSPVRFSW